MSVIVRTPSGQIQLFCKGADNVIYERLCDTLPAESAADIRQVIFIINYRKKMVVL